MFLLALAVLAQQTVPDVATVPYLWAWVAVAFIGATPGVIAAFVGMTNRKELATVRHEVTPSTGDSSYDLLHRLVWETHEIAGRTEHRVEAIHARVEVLEVERKERDHR